MNKAWVTLYICASTRTVLLDTVPKQDLSLFIWSFRRAIARRGFPNQIISHNDKNFVAEETQRFISKPKLEW